MLRSIINCKTNKDYHFELFTSIQELGIEVWNTLNTKNNIYLSYAYLQALEKGMQNKMQFCYLTFFNAKNEAVGIAVFQVVHFQTNDLLQERVPCGIADKIQLYFFKDKNMCLLVLGNLFACGENGFVHNNKISNNEFFDVLIEAIAILQNSKINDDKISFSLIKDIWMDSKQQIKRLQKASFIDFNADANMILKMRPEWLSLDLYLADMKTKYRTRAKGVFKKSEEIQTKNLTSDQIEMQLEFINRLYKQVIDKAEYNLGSLEAKTFLFLKQQLGDAFLFTGYFLKDKMIGFTSCFLYLDILDANFVGIDYEYNNSYKLYQRMLYDFVSFAILYKKRELRLGRTAETSKSVVGAIPVQMKLFAKHRNLLPSKLLQPLLSSIVPKQFEYRKPFKN